VSSCSHPLHVGIVAGEASGDNIAAGLIQAIRQREPDAVFEGVAGPRMKEAGCFSLYPMEKLSVMGLVEVLKHLPELFAMRRELRRHFLENPPDIFIGIDAPDFNLSLEKSLKRAGIRTLHYVSPSVWAWRQYRVLIADDVDPLQARKHLGITHAGLLVALLPGSRVAEVKRLAGDFLKAANWCYERRSDMRFIVPLANDACRSAFEEVLASVNKQLPVTLLNGQGLEAMAAANAVMLASGTATLECMLIKRPMVMAYRLSPLTYQLARLLVNTPYYSLPNLLADQPLVREFIQDDISTQALGEETLRLVENPENTRQLTAVFTKIHNELRQDASRIAADTIMEMTGRSVTNG
jgi:lipid-A-disaccharide synthase